MAKLSDLIKTKQISIKQSAGGALSNYIQANGISPQTKTPTLPDTFKLPSATDKLAKGINLDDKRGRAQQIMLGTAPTGNTELKPEPTPFERVGKTASSAAKSFVGGFVNAAEVLSPSMRLHKQANPGFVDFISDNLPKEAAEDAERAKEGLGKVGSTAVDVGIGGLQLAGDAALAFVTGGGSLAPMAARVFGSSAHEAEQSGATKGEQLLYGGLSALTSVGVGKLSNVGKTLSKTYGKGLLDKYLESATGNAISRFAQTRGGTAALAALGEGTEEMIESALSPLYKKITFDPNARWNAEEILYDGLVGGILGGIVGGVGGVDSQGAKQETQSQDVVSQKPNFAPTSQDVAQNTPQESVQAPQNAQNVSEVKLPTETQTQAEAIAEGDSNLPQGQSPASLGFDPYTNMQNKFGNIPEGESPARMIDVPAQTSEAEKVSRGVRTALEAETTPDKAVEDIQNAVADGKFSYLPVTDNSAKGRAEQTIKTKGWDSAVTDWTADARKGVVSKDNIVLGQTLYNNAINSGNTNQAVDILVDLVKMSRSGAQATQANRVLKTLSPEYQLYALERSVQSLSGELSAKLGKKFNGIEINKDLVQQYLDAKTEADKNTAMDSIKNDIAAQVPSTWMDKWNAWRYLSMLGNPRTHIRNIVGNAGFAPVRAVKNVVAYGIEKASGVKDGTKAILTSKDKPLIETAMSDYDSVSDEIMSLGKMDNFTGDIDSRRKIFKTKALEKIRQFNGAALDTEDVWFSKPTYSRSLAGWYKANGVTADMLQSGSVSQATIDKARAYAIREAQRATYRDSNQFSDWVSKLGRGYTGTNKVAKAANVLVEGVLPFKRTPANILARATEYSPLGLMKGLSYDLAQVKNGNMEAWQAIDNISAGLTGTALLGLGAWLASLGLLTGGASDDDKQKEIDKLTGRQDYALNVGDKSITLDWLAPEALPIFVGVELYNAFSDKNEDGANVWTVLNKLSGITDPMFEMSMLQGVNDLFDSVKYSEGKSITGVVTTSAVNYLSQALPTLFGQAERIFEPERKTTYVDRESGVPQELQYMLGKVSGKVPFWEYSQIPYTDALGQNQLSGSAPERAVNNLLNPAYVKDNTSSAVTDELQRLKDKNELVSVPKAPKKYFEYKGERYDLSADRYSKFQQTAGQSAQKLMSNAIASGEYEKLSDPDKAQLLSDIISYSNDLAKRELVGSKYESSTYGKVYEAQQQGISPVDYYFYKAKLNEIDENGSTSYAESAEAINGVDISTDYKSRLWALQNPTAKAEKNPFTGTLAQKGMKPDDVIAVMDFKTDKKKGEFIAGLQSQFGYSAQQAYFIYNALK